MEREVNVVMNLEAYINLYKENGYIKELRKHIGHAPIMGTAGGVIVENSNGEILLQKRKDNNCWGLIGGSMEIGESIKETVKREAYEEAGIRVHDLELFGIYTGKDRFITYPNGDICYVTSIIFITTNYDGEIINQEDEVLEHRFFDRNNIPKEINTFDRVFIEDWLRNDGKVIIR